VDSELVRKLASRGTGLIARYQLFDLGWAQPSMDLLSGVGAYFWGPSWDHFYEVPKTFSLFEGVRVTSDELHCKYPVHCLFIGVTVLHLAWLSRVYRARDS
jgi:hypothetical protein